MQCKMKTEQAWKIYIFEGQPRLFHQREPVNPDFKAPTSEHCDFL